MSARGARRPWPWVAWLVVILAVFTRNVIADEEAAVPISLQIELLLKVAGYDKSLPERAADRVRLMVLVKAHDDDSARAAGQALRALSQEDKVIGLPLESSSSTYTDAAALARHANAERLSILYLTPGFTEGEVAAMGRALEGVSLLSAGAVAKYASHGMVLGFDLAGGKTKLLVHLGQAKKQDVELSSSVLKLMRVIE